MALLLEPTIANYYNSNNGPNSMGNQNNNDQYSVTGFRPADQPFNNWQEGDANSDTICQTELGTWGFKLQNGENNNCTTTGTACGIHHFARMNAAYMPWGSDGTVPAQALTFSLSLKPQTISAKPSGVWGYVCPILKDTTSSKYIEYCFDNWEQGGGFPNVTHNDEIGDCADFGGSSSLATIVTDFNSSSMWSTERAGTTSDSEKGSVILGTSVTQAASITSQNLQNVINQIRKPAPPKGVAHDGLYGCAYSEMSTNPANYQVIGFEDGMEGGGYSLLGESLTNEHMRVTTDTLFPGDTLASGPNPNDGTMWSADGNYKLVMQGDGNLVIYTKNNGLIWQSHTSGVSIQGIE